MAKRDEWWRRAWWWAQDLYLEWEVKRQLRKELKRLMAMPMEAVIDEAKESTKKALQDIMIRRGIKP
jgi:hypothetical protein